MNGCEHSIDLARTQNTSRQMSSRGHLIVSRLRQGFSHCNTIIFTSWGLISRVVISSVLVWARDARKRTSPEVCIPTATCHFSQWGHKSTPQARMTTQSQERDTTSKLFSCLFNLVAHWTLAEQVMCSVDVNRSKESAFATALYYLHLSSVGCVSNSFYGFTVYSPFILL